MPGDAIYECSETIHQLAAMDEPGLKAEDVFKKTAANVYQATGKQQFPYIEGVVIGNFYFLPNVKSLPKKGITGPDQNLTEQTELMYWQSVEKNPGKESYEAYLKRWPEGHFAELARLNLQKKTSQSVTQGETENRKASLTIQQISGIFSDKTVSTIHHFKKVETKRYYSPDGKLTIKVLDSDKVIEAKWAVNNEAKLCHKIPNKSMQCRRIEIDGDEVKLYTPNGQPGMTFSNFSKGNQL